MKDQIRWEVPLAHSLFAIGCILSLAQQTALAAPSFTAVNNATVQPGGPRTGTNGKRFLNVEGSANNSFASFGIADFRIPTGVTFTSGGALSLTLTQANASFTNNGSLAFYLTTDTTDSIDPGSSPLRYQSSAAPSGLGAQLATTYLLGTGNFTEVADGAADLFSFTPSGAALSYLTTQVNTAGLVRLILAPNDPTVAATYAGFSNTTIPGPLLSFTAATPVPEPATLSFGVVGLGLLAAFSYMRQGKLRTFVTWLD